jgi:hypothetical protein
LGLTDDQTQKIRDIMDKARSRTLVAIKEVLTEEQAKQFEQMCLRAGQFGPAGRGPAMQDNPAGPAGRRLGRGQGRGPQMGPEARWNERPARQRNQPDVAAERPAGRQANRMAPPIEQRFDEIDANHDGSLTREEIRAFHEKMGPGVGRQRP